MQTEQRKKLMLLINPNAGRGMYRMYMAEMLSAFHQAGWLTTVYFTDGVGDATELAAREAPGYDRIVCVGGDGTLSETVAGLTRCEAAPPLGYIPLGTTNDCANTLGLSRFPGVAARTAAAGRRITLDTGCFRGGENTAEESFVYVAAFGAFTEVSYVTPQGTKHLLGQLAYFLEAAHRLPRVAHHVARVTCDGQVVEGDFIYGSVTNSRSVAGLIRLRERAGVDLSDGMFELILVRNPLDARDLGNAIGDLLGGNFNNRSVILLHGREIHFDFDEPVAWTRDGESGGSHASVTIRNRHGALHMVVGDRDIPVSEAEE